MPRAEGPRWYHRSIRLVQVISIGYMWIFLASVVFWILHLVSVSRKLGDALTASVGISIVAIPVYTLVAGILTYVFIGLWRGANDEDTGEGED
jgi:hypothetical protein